MYRGMGLSLQGIHVMGVTPLVSFAAGRTTRPKTSIDIYFVFVTIHINLHIQIEIWDNCIELINSQVAIACFSCFFKCCLVWSVLPCHSKDSVCVYIGFSENSEWFGYFKGFIQICMVNIISLEYIMQIIITQDYTRSQ